MRRYTYFDMLGKLDNSPCCHSWLALDNLSNTLGNICRRPLVGRCTIQCNGQAWYYMCSNLTVGFNERAEECKQGLQSLASDKRRGRNIVCILQHIVFDFWEARSRSKG